MKNLLTIAGSDCSGGAGIQADLKTFAAHGAYGMSVIVSVVAENTRRVISIQDIEPAIIADQLDAVFEDIQVDGVKVGMLSNAAAMRAVAGKLRQYSPVRPVIDPVMIAKGGSVLMQADALDTLEREIIPLAFILTPNIPEAETLAGMKILSVGDMKKAAEVIRRLGAENVLIKGGHLSGDAEDVLFDGERFYSYRNKRIPSKNTHGTGCTLSSAIAANLANGITVTDAVASAKVYVTGAIAHTLPIGRGNGPANHLYKIFNDEGQLYEI